MSETCGLNVAEKGGNWDQQSVSSAQTSWFVLTVKPNLENSLAVTLAAKQYETFSPAYRLRRQWSDRVKELSRPLFPGYLFCKFSPQKPLPILSTPGVVSIVSFGKILAAVDETEILAVRALVNSGLPVSPWPFLKQGQRIRIIRGSLEGLEGIFLRHKDGGCRLVVSVTLLQRSVSAEIPSDWISP